MYAQFSDAPDAPGPENTPSPEGNVQFGKNGEIEAQRPQPLPTQENKCPSTKLVIIAGIVTVIVIAFTLANFIMLMEIREGMYMDTKVQNVILNMNNTMLARIRGQCRISYNGKCFWAIRRGNMEYIDGMKACRAHDALPANIYSKVHFDMIGAYLKHTRSAKGDSVWVGMKRDLVKRKNLFRDGTEVSFQFRWYAEGYPKTDDFHEQIALHYDEDARFNGFMNEEATDIMKGVLCEI